MYVIYSNGEMKTMKMWKTIFAVLGVAVMLTACNTMRGVGKDIEKGGEAIQKAADK